MSNCNEVQLVAISLKNLAPRIRPSKDKCWTRPLAVKVVDCVLSLNRNYDRFVVPRLDRLQKNHPHLQHIHELAALIASHPTPDEFVRRELDYHHANRARILKEVVTFLAGNVLADCLPDHEASRLREWADRAQPSDHQKLGIKGFGLAGFQYLRMLFGANTTKPDIRIVEFVENAVGHKKTPAQAFVRFEQAAIEAGVSIRDADTTIWECAARGCKSDRRK
jgi:hypothetical protein